MRGWQAAGELMALSLWVAGTWVVGYLVAPVLFAALPERSLAGQVAGILFSRMGLLGLACALVLMASQAVRAGGVRTALRSVYGWSVLLMVAFTVFNLGVAQPQIAALKAAGWPLTVPAGPDLFAVWHGVSALVYLLQSVLGAAALVGWLRLRGADGGGRS